jgi:hypothetical protein
MLLFGKYKVGEWVISDIDNVDEIPNSIYRTIIVDGNSEFIGLYKSSYFKEQYWIKMPEFLRYDYNIIEPLIDKRQGPLCFSQKHGMDHIDLFLDILQKYKLFI